MPAIGIDLGTTNSCVAVYRKDQVEIIANDQGHRVTPSYVSFTEEERLVGDAAKLEAPSNFENTLFQIKRLIGRPYDDPMVQADLKLWGFTVENDNNIPQISIVYCGQRRIFYPEEISAMILQSLKKSAEDRLGEPVTHAVITVPAYFNDAQRSATRDAGTIAGLNVLRMINEPTAAAIAYGLDRTEDEEQNVLVFDVGGGTFDVTIVNISGKCFDVKATGGDTHLGGEDFDNRMVDHFVEEFNAKNGCDMSKNKRGLNRLRVACEAAKRRLSVSTKAVVQVDGLHDGIDFKGHISRAQFEELNYDFFEKTIETVKNSLSSARMHRSEIDTVVLVGGSTRIPRLQELLEEFFEGKKIKKTINPDEAVAYGAAALAANISEDESLEKIEELTIFDVVPLSLGWRTRRGTMVKVVERNTKIPIEKWSRSCTSEDNQKEISFTIFEGEREVADDNHFLGRFYIEDIPLNLRGEESFDICFSVDCNGILTVRARSVSTGTENQITIAGRGKLTEEEIRKMTEEAKRFRIEDLELTERNKQAHKLENYVYAVKHAASGAKFRNKLSDNDKNKIIEKCKEIISWMNNNRSPEIEDSVRKEAELEDMCNTIFRTVPSGPEFLRKIKN